MFTNKLILGDNLEKLKEIESNSIDLIYADPPFFSNRNYEVIWGDDGEIRSFQDRWSGGIEHYIGWLKERVDEMYRVLKPTGSLFLHCDWHADAYIRVDILDKIFSPQNFRNHIVWKRKNSVGQSNKKSNQFGYNADSIFFYSKTKNNVFNTVFIDSNPNYIEKFFIHKDPDGRVYRLATLTSPSLRPNLTYEYKGHKPPEKGWAISLEKMIEWDEKGKIYIPDDVNKRIQRKIYLDEIQGHLVQTIWDDIDVLSPSTKERIGYPTQKPEALLERIIECATNEGDIVLDPFVGGGTTIAVADKLNRKWIGIDQSVAAVKVSDLRLKKQQNLLFSQPYDLQLRTYNYDFLRNMDAFAFETMIIEQFGGTPNTKQRNDLGLDGKMPDNTPIQVKRSDNIGRSVIDNFFSAVQRSDKRLFEKNKTEKKPIGYIIAFSFGKGAIEEVARLRNKEHIIIELKKVSDILSCENAPKVSLTADKIEQYKYAFEASAESESGVAFYAWDFNHNPEDGFKAEIYLDKDGKQVRQFPPGERQIAVEAVDKSGLDGMDKVKIKVKE